MNVPAIAKRTFDELKHQSEFLLIVHKLLKRLKKMSDSIQRARLVHGIVDDFNQEVFAHPLVKQLSPCTKGCSACCHTQVSVTEDEADLLAERVKQGAKLDADRLKIQIEAKNDAEAFFKIPYEHRQCVFLQADGSCGVYDDRPSICRTNSVIGPASQCDTSESQKPLRLVRTQKADMAIYASFYFNKDAGTLPFMLAKKIFSDQ